MSHHSASVFYKPRGCRQKFRLSWWYDDPAAEKVWLVAIFGWSLVNPAHHSTQNGARLRNKCSIAFQLALRSATELFAMDITITHPANTID